MFAQVNVATVRHYAEHSSNINLNPAHLAEENICYWWCFSIDFGNNISVKFYVMLDWCVRVCCHQT